MFAISLFSIKAACSSAS